ncbi:MAG: GTP cyclohydrolase IIa [Candidatus Hermodarchaeota archaeon]
MIQLTFIQIDNFGPYTEEMGHNREHRIQILLSKIYIFLQKEFNRFGGLVFSASKDNMIAVSNGISIKYHQIIIDKLEKRFPITVSMGIGIGNTPLDAQNEASKVLIDNGSAQSSRKKVLVYNGHKLPIFDNVKVAHVDINYYTKLATDVNPFYNNYIDLNRGYLTLMEGFLTIGVLCFFNGGDNFICICPNSMEPNDLKPTLKLFEYKHKPWKLKVGIGVGKNILDAISKANICLKEIREHHNNKQIVSLI